MNFVHRSDTISRIALLLFIAAGFSVVPSLAAPPKRIAEESRTVENEAPEIPAVVYLTLGLIREPSVQKELGVSAGQLEQLQKTIAEVDEPLWRLRDIPVTKCAAQLDACLKTLQHGIQQVLTGSQQERLQQIILQARSWKAVVSPEIAQRLDLSKTQLSQLRNLLEKLPKKREADEKKLAELPPGGREAARGKMRKAESKEFANVLSSRQQTRLGEMLGQPFDLDHVQQIGCVAPELRDVSAWINSEPVSLQQLRGKVVVIHFWAFGCINCIRNLPHYDSWYEKFPKSEVTIIGLQTPETAAERSLDNLKKNVIERNIQYPVAFDAASENWKAWGNDIWPSVYLIDKQGRVRYWWYGELNWQGAPGEETMRKRIEELIAER